METTFEKIIRKSGMKPSNCKCQLCKSQCASPCLGTPEDMVKIIAAGFSNRVMIVPVDGMQVITPLYEKNKKACTFFTNGLCELHDIGLKPTVGKLSHHSTSIQNFNPKKSIHEFVLDEWKNITNEKFEKLLTNSITTKKGVHMTDPNIKTETPEEIETEETETGGEG